MSTESEQYRRYIRGGKSEAEALKLTRKESPLKDWSPYADMTIDNIDYHLTGLRNNYNKGGPVAMNIEGIKKNIALLETELETIAQNKAKATNA